ncbi:MULTISPECIES: hypothetical protein [unclassified Janthinobacterium]|uniref:hypothetical protein n=1 Tax=unclassified Janthinobacterium TaxID=2610881 RepID=UPI0016150CB0|nr:MULTISPECIES: hypothetical protein [unclassified Janthinobacterium]MBB5606653.1 hypothetical protein [Janthinobacterium sp. S3T4]MBB5612297.1 hypothetical protein [Janthinobacterium sp. S3M3]
MLILLLCALSLPARAATQAEEERDKAPMPHETLAAPGSHAAMVKVHLVSGRSYLVGRPPNDDTTSLFLLHVQVNNCVRDNNASGRPSTPPRAWPDHLNSNRSDTYSALNRSITYAYGLTYGVNALDCSLLETPFHTARLSSSLGSCEIDLQEKTARGACDAAGHANARPPVRQPAMSAAQIAAIERAALGNPTMAALAAAIHSNPPYGTGERKTILGLECDVWKNPFDPEGTMCLSRGGSFTSSAVNGDLKQSGMMLEGTTTAGVKMWATQVQLDTMVNGAIFAPYLAGGFRIIKTGAHP